MEVEADERAELEAVRREARIAAGLKPTSRPWSLDVNFKLTRRGWAVVGPLEKVHRGTMLVRNATTGRTREVFVTRLGRPFTQDGVEQVYGYLRR